MFKLIALCLLGLFLIDTKYDTVSVKQMKKDLIGKEVKVPGEDLPFPFLKGYKCELKKRSEKTSDDQLKRWFEVQIDAEAC